MPFGIMAPSSQLFIGDSPVQYVTTHLYLGVWFDSRLSFRAEVNHLRDRTKLRLSALRALAGKGGEASYKVLRLFYTQAIRSIVDYGTPALLSLDATLLTKLEVIQNEALRAITDSPM